MKDARTVSESPPANLPVILVPGLNCSARLYAEQIPALWRFGPVAIADHTRDDSMPAIARRILAAAPPRFALAGLSMGGYIALEMTRQAPERVAKLALLDTSSRPETPEQTKNRLRVIELAEKGRFAEVADLLFPIFVHRERRDDEALKGVVRLMAEETGAEAFLRQERAIIGRADARPGLAAIKCPTLVLVGDGDELTPPHLSEEIAAGIAGARLVVVADCGHLSTLERPAAVTAATVEWMKA
ncbi:MAG TPA: alpha/beta fold hydrolase [Xanthobacteraceae bacterium]|nr:alpha/beta fold hydrolase [Xanthobacteraceae bacterium]